MVTLPKPSNLYRDSESIPMRHILRSNNKLHDDEERPMLQQASVDVERSSTDRTIRVDEVDGDDNDNDHHGLDERLDDFLREQGIETDSEQTGSAQWARARLALAFFTFGLLNNVLYVIVLSAAQDLVPSNTPKGVVAFFNIFPALIAKVAWPYLSDGHIRYNRRIMCCTGLSWLGMVIIASFDSVMVRLLGIAIASFSSGLGELTFLQMSTALPTSKFSKVAVGAWSSGTGGAGIAGAGLWWLLRNLGVTKGLGIASFLPLCFPLVLRFLLPPFARVGHIREISSYAPIFAADDDASEVDFPAEAPRKVDLPIHTGLTFADKFELVKPLVFKYMLWLFLVYVFEYIINTGVAPVLAFDVPTEGAWTHVFKKIQDFYPFWSLTYQTFVFISRSLLTLQVPALRRSLLPLPAILQGVILTLLSLQASRFIFSSPRFFPGAEATSATSSSTWDKVADFFGGKTQSTQPRQGSDQAITAVFWLIALEGMCGGTAYCMTFYHVGRDGDSEDEDEESARKDKMQRAAFKIGAVGAADSLGILIASLISMPVEVALCKAQVRAGRSICKQL